MGAKKFIINITIVLDKDNIRYDPPTSAEDLERKLENGFIQLQGDCSFDRKDAEMFRVTVVEVEVV